MEFSENQEHFSPVRALWKRVHSVCNAISKVMRRRSEPETAAAMGQDGKNMNSLAGMGGLVIVNPKAKWSTAVVTGPPPPAPPPSPATPRTQERVAVRLREVCNGCKFLDDDDFI
ncbi:hypothetical protein R5R35_014402 [Gryllus longicercus]|uniref:Uncharacterized protein n=1 Tax=Gryllus longicercus TaxID=2509291 RepID=A0AAN9YU00_9ORTH